LVNVTNLTPPLFTKSACANPGKWAAMYMFLMVSILTVLFFQLNFGVVLKVLYFLFHFITDTYQE
jgi:hypothetical protein